MALISMVCFGVGEWLERESLGGKDGEKQKAEKNMEEEGMTLEVG